MKKLLLSCITGGFLFSAQPSLKNAKLVPSKFAPVRRAKKAPASPVKNCYAWHAHTATPTKCFKYRNGKQMLTKAGRPRIGHCALTEATQKPFCKLVRTLQASREKKAVLAVKK